MAAFDNCGGPGPALHVGVPCAPAGGVGMGRKGDARLDPAAEPATDGQDDSPVTISVVLQVSPGREPEFETFLTGITDEAARFPGFAGVRALRPRGSGRNYQVVLRFDSPASARRWRDSE